jgi:hypothetical protein
MDEWGLSAPIELISSPSRSQGISVAQKRAIKAAEKAQDELIEGALRLIEGNAQSLTVNLTFILQNVEDAVVIAHAPGHHDAPTMVGEEGGLRNVRCSTLLRYCCYTILTVCFDWLVKCSVANTYLTWAKALFSWAWNEPEVPKAVTAGAWWLVSLLSQSRCPVGVAAGPLCPARLSVLGRCEAAALYQVSVYLAALAVRQATYLES